MFDAAHCPVTASSLRTVLNDAPNLKGIRLQACHQVDDTGVAIVLHHMHHLQLVDARFSGFHFQAILAAGTQFTEADYEGKLVLVTQANLQRFQRWSRIPAEALELCAAAKLVVAPEAAHTAPTSNKEQSVTVRQLKVRCRSNHIKCGLNAFRLLPGSLDCLSRGRVRSCCGDWKPTSRHGWPCEGW